MQFKWSKARAVNGSALLTILIFTAFFGAVVGGLLKYGGTEMNVNERHFVAICSQNAVESILEANAAELVKRWQNTLSVEGDALINTPLSISTAVQDVFDGTNIEFSNSSITGGVVSDGKWIYVHPDDPSNRYDPAKGQNIYARNVTLLAKVEAKSTHSTPYKAFAKMIFQIRDNPLFAHSVFYGMDMEFHPGPAMSMEGPVHSNKDIYASAVSDIYFNGQITSAGGYYHGMAPNHPEAAQGGNVWISNGTQYITDYTGSGSKTDSANYYDSNHADWATLAVSRWNGNLLTGDQGVQSLNLVSFPEYERDDPSTAAVDDDLNYAYALIEPNLKIRNKLDHADYKGQGEQEKFAHKAGLIIRVHNTTVQPNNKAVQLAPNHWVTFHKLVKEDGSNPYSATDLTNQGAVKEVNVKMKPSFVRQFLSLHEYAEDGSGTPTSSFYDLRRGKALDVLEVDVDKFREAVDDTDTNYDGDSNGIWKNNYSPRDDYNGLVYVEFPWDQSQGGRPDNVVTGDDNYGLLLKNGSTVPNPSYNNTAARGAGFTVAANNHIYVQGHYNADGQAGTGSATEADDSNNPNPPAALAGDAITFLSENWDFSKSKSSNKNDRPAAFTEITAALLQGLVPTGKEGSMVQSGGVHNFPRLLENWSGQTLRMRGAMAALFESEISTQAHHGAFYSPPIRDWGFYTELGEGSFPPGTPNTRSFSRASLKFLNEAEYLSELAN